METPTPRKRTGSQSTGLPSLDFTSSTLALSFLSLLHARTIRNTKRYLQPVKFPVDNPAVSSSQTWLASMVTRRCLKLCGIVVHPQCLSFGLTHAENYASTRESGLEGSHIPSSFKCRDTQALKG